MRAVLPCELAACLAIDDFVAGTVPFSSDENRNSPLPREEGKLPTGESVEIDGNILRIGSGDPLRIQPLIDGLRSRGQVILSVQLLRQSLEDFFIQSVSDAPSQGGRP